MRVFDLLNKINTRQKMWILLAAGISGMLLIFASRPAADPVAVVDETELFTMKEQSEHLEEKLSALIAEIEGVGRVRVMITLENSGETIYVQEEKRVVDRQAGESGAFIQKESSELKYVMIENGSGRRQALVETQREPKIQGVVVVCEGANDVNVQLRVTNVVTTALHIPSTRVCVEKIRSD